MSDKNECIVCGVTLSLNDRKLLRAVARRLSCELCNGTGFVMGHRIEYPATLTSATVPCECTEALRGLLGERETK